MTIHAGATRAPITPGACIWRHRHPSDPPVYLRCDDTAIPGGLECYIHLIARVAAMPDEYWLIHDRMAAVGA